MAKIQILFEMQAFTTLAKDLIVVLGLAALMLIIFLLLMTLFFHIIKRIDAHR